ncbi:choice-of-anchor L family PEP-CTERM protein [Oxynema aestuarii]|nr:choice-of-anchor L domain-containing protein [Oxynema aestuarii]
MNKIMYNGYRGAIASLSAIASFVATPVMAFSITPGTSNLLDTLLGDTTGLSDFSLTTIGSSQAFGQFTDDPFGLGSGIVLSTGKVAEIPGENTLSVYDFDLNHDFAPTALPGYSSGELGDNIQLDLSFFADSSVEKLFFNYVFGSEEFREYGGSPFNDSFELLLNGINLAKLSDGQNVTINNLVPSYDNPSLDHPDYINNPVGSGVNTKLDGYTRTLGFEGLLAQNNRNTLSIRIKDVGDGWLDSAVFIQAGSVGTVPVTAPGVSVPEPSLLLGLLAMGSFGLFGGLKKKQGL